MSDVEMTRIPAGTVLRGCPSRSGADGFLSPTHAIGGRINGPRSAYLPGVAAV